MSISNRRTGKIGPPPGSYDTEWLNRLRILLEELGGLQKLPAYPSAREAVVYDGVSQIWESHSLDDWFYLGDGINDGGNIYDCPIPDPRFAFLVTGAGGFGSPPPNLNRPPIGTLAYFRADAGNTGPSYLRIHIDLPDVSGFEHEILRMDGSSLVSGDIVAGQFVTVIFDADSMEYGDPARGWRMIEGPPPDLSGYVPTSRTLTAGIGLSGGGDLTLDRTINLDVSDLTAETSPVSGDYVPLYDVSASATRKVTLSNLLTDTTHRHSVVSFTATNQGGVTIQAGQPVRISSGLNGVELAQGNSLGSCAAGVAETQITVGATGTIVVQGLINVANWTSATGASDLVGGRWFLSAGAAGILTQTPPTVVGNYVQYIGQAITARYLLVKVESPLGL